MASLQCMPSPFTNPKWELLEEFVAERCDAAKARDLLDHARSLVPAQKLTPEIVTVSRSTAKPAQPHHFHGTLKDHGEPANLWLFSFSSWIDASNESTPMKFVPGFLRDDALTWWKSFGMKKLSVTSTVEQFATIFLEKYVKASDSIDARAELEKLVQGKQSVESYAGKFIQTRSRISVGTQVDSTTQAHWFMNGLNSNVKAILRPMTTSQVMNDIELLMPAAIEADTKLVLSAKQACDQDKTSGPTRNNVDNVHRLPWLE